jgi:hypothetical protein
MIVSAVADPAVFGPEGITDKLTRREAIAFLRGIVQNGVLLDGPTKELLRQSLAQVATLKTQDRQSIQILLEEISKQHKKFIVKCSTTNFATSTQVGSAEQLANLALKLKADVIVTIPKTQPDLSTRIAGACEVIPIEDVTESQYEQTRLRLFNNSEPIDNMQASDLEELIGRSLKYTSTLRIFDYLMAGSVPAARKCQSGIKFFVLIWSKWCVLDTSIVLSIELFAAASRQSATGFIDATSATTNLNTIVAGLHQLPRVQAKAFVKSDDNKMFHTRGLESRGRTYTLDPGFDSLAETGPVRRCMFKLELAAEVQFRDCRQLPDA